MLVIASLLVMTNFFLYLYELIVLIADIIPNII